MSREHKDRIQGIRSAIASHIQEFTVRINRRRVSSYLIILLQFYGNISIEKLVTDMAFNSMLIRYLLKRHTE